MNRRIWSLEDIKTVAERYPQEGPSSLAQLLGRSEDSVMSLARRCGLRSIHRRSRQARSRSIANTTVDVHFFDRVSPEVAYALGFIFGCGTVKTHTRKTLRLRCPISREPALRKVLDLMGSRHIDQRGRRRILVEVGNSRLVGSLLANYGRPPCHDNPDPPFPPIPEAFIPDFFRGLLDAAGETQPNEVRCWGPPRLIEGLCHAIAMSKGYRTTEITGLGRRKLAIWRDIVEVLAMRRWLASAG